MSRVGRLPVVVPSGVQVNIQGLNVTVKGPKGQLARTFAQGVTVEMEEGHVVVRREGETPALRALHGTTRALIHNMVTGVSDGFTKTLEIDGVGYHADMNGKNLVLYVGYSHPVEVTPPDGITFESDTKAHQVKVSGTDKELVGQVASNIRSIRPPEPYHGKGIRYADEKIRRKAGKAAKAKGKK